MHRHTLREQVEEMARLGYSPATIRDDLDCSHQTARSYVRLWRQAMRQRCVELPPCRCGRIHEHQGNCIEKRWLERPWARRQIPADFAVVAPTMFVTELVSHYRVGWRVLRRWIASTPHISVKKRMQRQLLPNGRSSSRIADPLFQEIECHIPLGLAEDIRADLISEIYVTILEGSMSLPQLRAEGWKFVGRVIEAYGVSTWSKTISLDAQTADGRPLSDTIADGNAEDAFERIFEDNWDQ